MVRRRRVIVSYICNINLINSNIVFCITVSQTVRVTDENVLVMMRYNEAYRRRFPGEKVQQFHMTNPNTHDITPHGYGCKHINMTSGRLQETCNAILKKNTLPFLIMSRVSLISINTIH